MFRVLIQHAPDRKTLVIKQLAMGKGDIARQLTAVCIAFIAMAALWLFMGRLLSSWDDHIAYAIWLIGWLPIGWIYLRREWYVTELSRTGLVNKIKGVRIDFTDGEVSLALINAAGRTSWIHVGVVANGARWYDLASEHPMHWADAYRLAKRVNELLGWPILKGPLAPEQSDVGPDVFSECKKLLPISTASLNVMASADKGRERWFSFAMSALPQSLTVFHILVLAAMLFLEWRIYSYT